MMTDAERTQRSRDELLDGIAAALILLMEDKARALPQVYEAKRVSALMTASGRLEAYREHLTKDREFEEKHRK